MLTAQEARELTESKHFLDDVLEDVKIAAIKGQSYIYWGNYVFEKGIDESIIRETVWDIELGLQRLGYDVELVKEFPELPYLDLYQLKVSW